MTDVAVGQEHARRHAPAVQSAELRHHVRCRVEKVRQTKLAIDKAETGYALRFAFAFSDVFARRLLAAELRNAAILRDAEDDEFPSGRGRSLTGKAAAQNRDPDCEDCAPRN